MLSVYVAWMGWGKARETLMSVSNSFSNIFGAAAFRIQSWIYGVTVQEDLPAGGQGTWVGKKKFSGLCSLVLWTDGALACQIFCLRYSCTIIRNHINKRDSILKWET